MQHRLNKSIARKVLKFPDADIAETVELSFFPVMLNADVSDGIKLILEVGAEHSINPDADAGAFSLNLVFVPVIALKGSFCLFPEGIPRFRVIGLLWISLPEA